MTGTIIILLFVIAFLLMIVVGQLARLANVFESRGQYHGKLDALVSKLDELIAKVYKG